MNSQRRAAATPLYVVLGMHRGGTSALSRGLAVLGVSHGDNLWEAKPENERGFWEDRDTYALNESLLAALGEPWDSVGLYDVRRIDATRQAELLAQGRQLLAGKLQAHGSYGFKDPRTSRLLPFWRQVFAALAVEPRYLIATRNPLSVAQSLRSRNGIAEAQSHRLWQLHMLSALHWTDGCRRIVVDYDRLLQDPARELTRMRNALRVPVPAGMDDRLEDYRANFLSEGLRHARFGIEDLERAPGMTTGELRLARLLDGLATDRIAPSAAECADEVRALWAAMHGLPPALSLQVLLQADDRAFIEAAYGTLLQRLPDPGGLAHYLARLRGGAPKLRILAELAGSAEAAALEAPAPAMREALAQYRRSRLPLVGWLFAATRSGNKNA